MVVIKSQRAKELLDRPVAIKGEVFPHMRRYPSDDFKVWVGVEWEDRYVKNLSFSGDLNSIERLILEAAAMLMKKKNILAIDSLTARECEAFLRDRNSEVSIEGIDEKTDQKFKKFFQWMKTIPNSAAGVDYQYNFTKGPFKSLKLIDKIRELKGFLNSPPIHSLYRNAARPELIDVEDLTVFIQAPYRSEEDKARFEELHILGVEAFQEENLNFIPEA